MPGESRDDRRGGAVRRPSGVPYICFRMGRPEGAQNFIFLKRKFGTMRMASMIQRQIQGV